MTGRLGYSGRMEQIAIAFRAAQLVAHAFHNLVQGPAFLEHHEHLGELYAAYEEAYDSIVERIIGTGGSPDIAEITEKAASAAASMIRQHKPKQWAQALLDLEARVSDLIEDGFQEHSLGAQNLLQDLADHSEARSYKLGQIAKPVA